MLQFAGSGPGRAIQVAYMILPSNVAELSGYNPERVRRLAMHELGHVFGNDDMQTLPPGATSVMKQCPGLTNQGNNACLDGMPNVPTCSDSATVNFARTFVGPQPPEFGDIGAPVDCSALGGWSDSYGCCHQLPALGLSGSVNFHHYPPMVHITAPANNSVYSGPASITISAHALDIDGDAYRIDWIVDGQTVQVHQRDSSHTSTTWSLSATLPPKSTPYVIEAAAYDRTQTYSMSEKLYVTVNPPVTGPDVLASGEILWVNQFRRSPNGAYMLLYQSDGNLVFYGPSGPIAWTGTSGSALGTYMNPSGNIEVYNQGPTLVWQSGTGGNSGAYLRVQDNGRLALIAANGSILALW